VRIYLDGRRVAVSAATLIGQGGEAEVHALDDGRVLKLFKRPDHADLAGLPADQAAATARLAALQDKLPAFPRHLPARVVAPGALATDGRRGATIGYAMPRVAGDALAMYAEPRWRRDHPRDANSVVAMLRDLTATVAAVHAAGVVIGDFNDLNVLVDGERAWLIDADSFQYGRWPCPLFTERFVDPRLCDPAAPAPLLSRPHDRDSDGFALTVMIFRTLLCVSPYGGVHAPADASRRVPPSLRARRGVTVFDRDVVYPKAATPYAVLPDELLAHFDAVFARGQRGDVPRRLLDALRWTTCTACGAAHARPICPMCRVRVATPVASVRGAMRAGRLDPAQLAVASHAVGSSSRAPVWMAAGSLWRRSALGDEPIGQILPGLTRAWVGRRFGVGFWRAGGYQVGFVFRPDRRGLDERVRLPRVRGHVVSADAVVGDDLAWLTVREAHAGRDVLSCTAVTASGEVLATATASGDDPGWLAGAPVGCAVGAALFVATDAGIVRVEVVAGALAVTRSFPDTADFVSTGDALFAGPRGLDVRTSDGAFRLELT
jgi:hypothetical protein